MDTSFSWIKAYVPDLDCTAQEYTDAMTLSGTKVEGFTEFDKNLDKIVVGKRNTLTQTSLLSVRYRLTRTERKYR